MGYLLKMRFLLLVYSSVLILLAGGCGNGQVSPPSPPSPPTGLEGAKGYEKAYLHWDHSTGAATYTVYQSSDANGSYEKVANVSQSSCAIGSLANEKNYYFKVSASNSAGESSLSPSVGVNPGIAISNPYIEKLHVYKGQLHAHSNNSDGDLSPMALLEAYQGLGYDFMVISDHNYLTGDVQYPGILHLGGVEETSYEGHLITVNSQKEQSSLHAQDIINNTIADGGLAILAHPNYLSANYSIDELMSLNGYTAIEVFNALVEKVEGNGNAEAKWDALLTANRHIFGVAVDDMHSLFEANKAWVEVFADNPTMSELVDSLKNGNFYASTGPGLTLQMTGSTIYVQTDSISSIEFVSSGGSIIKKENDVLSSSYTAVGNEQYIRIRITRNSDGKKAWTNPIKFL